jgi:hypothetical protein
MQTRKKLKSLLIVLCILCFSFKALAHQSDASTTMLVQQEDQTWVLQVSASLTAFQHEINTHFSDTPYTTPKEFKEMVLTHIKNNLHIRFDENKEVLLLNGIVQLGHETKVVFKVIGVPTTIQSAVIENTAFVDIHKSQSALILLKDGFNKKHFVLNDDNDHTLSLRVDGKNFTEVTAHRASLFPPIMAFVFILIAGLVFIALVRRKNTINP